IIDDCTVRVDDFVYDGTGIDVRFYGGLGGDYSGGFSMSEEDLRRIGGYDGSEPVYAQLPEDRTFDDLDGISVWCVPVSASFGDGLFTNP
ncbi:MAG: DM13 domain-containing protein, partial [Deltaproteobacteria bacterium]|nr:DM13 domain-containing protein [Deltaproteobacteria bacterium]